MPAIKEAVTADTVQPVKTAVSISTNGDKKVVCAMVDKTLQYQGDGLLHKPLTVMYCFGIWMKRDIDLDVV